MKFPTVIDPSALSEIRRVAEIGGISFDHVRLGVRSGGCSGYSYVVEYESLSEARDDDINVSIDGLNFRIDSRSSLILEGSTLSYIDEGLNGKGFRFSNPRAVSECGCGLSFDIR